MEPVAGNPLGGFCEGGQAQAASTARPVPTHHNLDRGWLLKFLQHRVADNRLLRLIQKWLWAGVIEEGEWKDTKKGSPQGSGITPLTQKVILNLNG